MCFLFSLSGIIFLSVIALLLFHDSPYLIVSTANANRKPELADGVMGAIMMYVACLVVSGYFWFRTSIISNLSESHFDD